MRSSAGRWLRSSTGSWLRSSAGGGLRSSTGRWLRSSTSGGSRSSTTRTCQARLRGARSCVRNGDGGAIIGEGLRRTRWVGGRSCQARLRGAGSSVWNCDGDSIVGEGPQRTSVIGGTSSDFTSSSTITDTNASTSVSTRPGGSTDSVSQQDDGDATEDLDRYHLDEVKFEMNERA